ncbi:transpeptidase [Mycolicibacterium duvalii]|uniref:Transpeptidase n=1 Tax=Mycolicibacterium duvalii TaxID=39688 RepID=A0A7I7K404_9MYCO|nr:transpeptidase [Mycolicibacterium duvalii]
MAALAVGVVAPGALAACGSGGGPLGDVADDAPAQPKVTFDPADAAQEVNPTARIAVRVEDGTLADIRLTNTNGKVVAGEVNPERTSFTVTEPLGYGMTYTWSGRALGADGATVPVAGAFTTVSPATQVNGRFQLADGQTVGVAAPIILQFNASIPESARAQVEKALTVTTSPQVEGGWAWLPDEAAGSRAHWRTREYYPAGTTVHVDAKLYGVPFGDGAYGAADSTLDFAIGRRQVVKAEAGSHRIQVLDGAGAVIMDFPCSYGEGDLDRNVTRSGVHVVTEKYEDFYMTNPAAGYANVRERFAVRISNNGEFIHANPASLGSQGNSNVTNGCINLSLEDAEQYFHTAVYGDPVEVTGTRLQLSYADGDIWDWAVPWEEWVAMSALSDRKSPDTIPDTAPVTPSQAPQPAGARPGG